MATGITTIGLVNKCREFITPDWSDTGLNPLIKEAIIQCDRELRECDPMFPLAWDRHSFDGVQTIAPANITGITKADPGVFTAAAHGFHNHSTIRDIVSIDSVAGMDELNRRLFLLEWASSSTFSLKTLDGLDAVDTTNYTTYTSGGVVYHAGFVLNTTTILANVATKWGFKRVVDSPRFEGYAADPISEMEADSEPAWRLPGSMCRPYRWRYWQNMTNPDTPTVNHYLFWYPLADAEYNVIIPYQREVPDISVWDAVTYPFHPPEVHDALWHGALSKLSGNNRRAVETNSISVSRIEVMLADRWIKEWELDKERVRRLSRKMHGLIGGSRGFSA